MTINNNLHREITIQAVMCNGFALTAILLGKAVKASTVMKTSMMAISALSFCTATVLSVSACCDAEVGSLNEGLSRVNNYFQAGVEEFNASMQSLFNTNRNK